MPWGRSCIGEELPWGRSCGVEMSGDEVVRGRNDLGTKLLGKKRQGRTCGEEVSGDEVSGHRKKCETASGISSSLFCLQIFFVQLAQFLVYMYLVETATPSAIFGTLPVDEVLCITIS